MRLTLAQLAESSGLDLGYSSDILVDQVMINDFGRVTHDEQWIHVDPAKAEDGPFGGTIAHGYLTLASVGPFLLELLSVEDAASALNYGIDRVRFPSPVPVGSRVRGRGQILEVARIDSAVQTKTRVSMVRDLIERPVCVADVLTRFLPKD